MGQVLHLLCDVYDGPMMYVVIVTNENYLIMDHWKLFVSTRFDQCISICLQVVSNRPKEETGDVNL